MRTFRGYETMVVAVFARLVGGCSGGELNVGVKYKVMQTIYLEGVFDSLDDETLIAETAQAFITCEKYAKRSEVTFQVEVPVDTAITVSG